MVDNKIEVKKMIVQLISGNNADVAAWLMAWLGEACGQLTVVFLITYKLYDII